MESEMCLAKSFHKISIAPMLDVTNHHYRAMMRLITKETLLYTEMIHHDTILHSKKGALKELEFDLSQKPLVIQMGGNNPDLLEKIAPLCKDVGFDEINLNCGCPSSKVMNAHFGACLMRNSEVVANCTRKMREVSGLEVSVKCRLGLNIFDYDFLNSFISNVSSKGQVNHFIMHARLALMNLDTDKNRKIPPLQYDTVLKLKKENPCLLFSLNGGIKTLEEIEKHLSSGELSGCMIGRAAYENPWMFADVDRRFFNKPNPGLTRKEIIYKYAEYCEEKQNEGVFLNDLLKPLSHLFSGERKNSTFKNLLYSYKKNKNVMNIGDHLKYVVEEYEKLNKVAVNKMPYTDEV